MHISLRALGINACNWAFQLSVLSITTPRYSSSTHRVIWIQSVCSLCIDSTNVRFYCKNWGWLRAKTSKKRNVFCFAYINRKNVVCYSHFITSPNAFSASLVTFQFSPAKQSWHRCILASLMLSKLCPGNFLDKWICQFRKKCHPW